MMRAIYAAAVGASAFMAVMGLGCVGFSALWSVMCALIRAVGRRRE